MHSRLGIGLENALFGRLADCPSRRAVNLTCAISAWAIAHRPARFVVSGAVAIVAMRRCKKPRLLTTSWCNADIDIRTGQPSPLAKPGSSWPLFTEWMSQEPNVCPVSKHRLGRKHPCGAACRAVEAEERAIQRQDCFSYRTSMCWGAAHGISSRPELGPQGRLMRAEGGRPTAPSVAEPESLPPRKLALIVELSRGKQSRPLSK